jgi:hypothetical protein
LIGFFLYFEESTCQASQKSSLLYVSFYSKMQNFTGEKHKTTALEKLKQLLLQNATLIFPDLNAALSHHGRCEQTNCRALFTAKEGRGA